MERVNIGCGKTPIEGWRNYDNSLSVFLSSHPVICFFFDKAGILNADQKEFIAFAQKRKILWADATKRIPLPNRSVEIVYASHMIEHLYLHELTPFFNEAKRILMPNGIIRVVVPDLRKLIDGYLSDGDANRFIERTLLTCAEPKTLVDRLKSFVLGNRRHKWMYDGQSMALLLSSMGFLETKILNAGVTSILNPGQLDLKERHDDSIYIEARSPR